MTQNTFFCHWPNIGFAELSGSLKGTSTAGGKSLFEFGQMDIVLPFVLCFIPLVFFIYFPSSHLPFSWSISYACEKVWGCWQKDKSARSFFFIVISTEGIAKGHMGIAYKCIIIKFILVQESSTCPLCALQCWQIFSDYGTIREFLHFGTLLFYVDYILALYLLVYFSIALLKLRV